MSAATTTMTNEAAAVPLPPPMRVAILLCGHFRRFHETGPYWEEFRRTCPHVDFFIFTWNEWGRRDGRTWITAPKTEADHPDFDRIRAVLQPVEMVIEDHQSKLAGFSLERPGRTIWLCACQGLEQQDYSRCIVSQLYAIHRAHQMCRRHEVETGLDYDAIFKVRADSTLGRLPDERVTAVNAHPFNLARLESLAPTVRRPDVLFIYSGRNHQHHGGGRGCKSCDAEWKTRRRTTRTSNGGLAIDEDADSVKRREHADHTNDVCDALVWGNSTVMRKYASMYENIESIYTGMERHNEAVLAEPRGVAVAGRFKRRDHKIQVPMDLVETTFRGCYPEAMIRVWMRDEWLLTDPLELYCNMKQT